MLFGGLNMWQKSYPGRIPTGQEPINIVLYPFLLLTPTTLLPLSISLSVLMWQKSTTSLKIDDEASPHDVDNFAYINTR